MLTQLIEQYKVPWIENQITTTNLKLEERDEELKAVKWKEQAVVLMTHKFLILSETKKILLKWHKLTYPRIMNDYNYQIII